MKFRRGQEEIVGFVVIIVIVAVAALVFLGIGIRDNDGGDVFESVDVSQFLESAMEYTSDCSVRFDGDYRDVGELFRECNSGSRCLDGKDSCEVLENLLREIMDTSWEIGEDRPLKGYYFTSVYSAESSEEQVIDSLGEECAGSSKGASYLISDFPGKIVNSLELCF